MPRIKYDLSWDDRLNDLHIELKCFHENAIRFGIPVERRAFHFKQICKMLWPREGKKWFQWNPWCDLMLESACREKYLWLSGCASSGKTSFAAVWAIINWLCEPDRTMILVTTTSLKDSERRIWGDIQAYFNAANDSLKKLMKGAQLPGKLLSSGRIRTEDGGVKYDSKCGILLLAGDASKEKENIGKIIGSKNSRVLMVADELPELSPALMDAARGNLMTNPFFQVIGLGNFKGVYDPFGVCCEPIDGWSSVNPDCEQWRTIDGLCLRFDGTKSPNVLLGQQYYAGIYGPEHLANHQKMGENTATFWRMCRSYPCPEADTDRIYSEADLLAGDVKSVVRWLKPPVKFSVLDPAFATGGDAAKAKFGLLGTSDAGIQTMQFYKHVELREDVRKKEESRSLQVAKQFRDLNIAENVPVANVGIDGSGGGLPFAALLQEIWPESKFLSIQFGGAPSMRAASSKDKRPAKDAFANRVAELWYAGVEYVQGNQIKGLNQQTCVELTERRIKDREKSSTGIKIRVESKKEMKLRTNGKSPDEGDGFALAIELCRERLNFRPVGMQGRRANPQKSFKQRVNAINRVYSTVGYETEEVEA